MHVRKAAGEYRRGHDAATTGVAEAEGVGDADDADGEALDDGPPEDATPDDGLLDEAAPDEDAPGLSDADVDGEQPASSAEPASTSTAAAARPRTVSTSRG